MTKRWVSPVLGVVLTLLVVYLVAGAQVEQKLGGPDWSLVPWYCYDHGEPRPHLEEAAHLDHPCSQDELPLSLARP